MGYVARKPRRVVRQHVVRIEHPPVARLQRCGATAEDVAAIYEPWRSWSYAERLEAVRALDHLSDDEVRAGLVELRQDEGYAEAVERYNAQRVLP